MIIVLPPLQEKNKIHSTYARDFLLCSNDGYYNNRSQNLVTTYTAGY